jgi:hypothetical protein
MAHFAQLDDNNKVLNVIVVNNEELIENDVELEAKGIAFCQSLFGENTRWVQTSFNGSFRKNFAGVDYTYDPIADHFYSPSVFASWILNENTARWEAPVPQPNDGKKYVWNEDNLEWTEFNVSGQ